MGLYIKGEKLPKYGYSELRVCPDGTLELRDKTDALVRIPNAVIEVKEPHGDLIDYTEMKFKAKFWSARGNLEECLMELIEETTIQPVIEAEGE